jgi:hypothetical protein
MRAGLRPYVSAGVALVGAGAIAVAPIAATPPDVKIANPDVQLAANPFDAYVEALMRVRTNIGILFLRALEDPAVPLTLEDLVDGLLADPSANFQEFVDGIEGLGPFLQLNLPALLGDAADRVQAAIDRAAEGDLDLVVVELIPAYLSLTPIVAEAISIPLPLLGRGLEQVTNLVLGKTLNAAIGPVISGTGKAGVAIRNIVNVLNEDPDPAGLLSALVGAPGTIADGVLNGPIAFPGILTPGDVFDATKPNPGPVSLAIGLAQGLGVILAPQADMLTSVSRFPEGSVRVRTFDLNVTPGLQQGAVLSGGSGPVVEEMHVTVDADDGTNKDVNADSGGADLPDNNKPRSRFFGGNSARQNADGTGLKNLRAGIRDGIDGFGEGVRDAVKSFTGRGDDGHSDETGEAP